MESSSSSSSIEMKVMSCKYLKAFNFFQKLSVYAVVCIASDDPSKKVQQNENQLQRTPTDTHGDGNPEWNCEVRFDLKSNRCECEDHLFLHFNLRHEGIVFGLGDRTIGEVRIPLKDLMEEASSNGVVRFVSYQVRSSDGKPNGVLNLSYKLIGCGTGNPNPYPYPNPKPNPNPNPNCAAELGSTISASGFPSSNRIQYPTVEVEPVLIPLHLMTKMEDQKPRECYWPTQPQPQSQPLDFWSHSYPRFQGHHDEAYYHSLHPPPPSYRYGCGGMKDGGQIKSNVHLWN